MVTWFESMTKCVHADGGYFENLDEAEIRTCARSAHPEAYGVTLEVPPQSGIYELFNY